MDEKQIEQVRPVLKENHNPLRVIDRSNMRKRNLDWSIPREIQQVDKYTAVDLLLHLLTGSEDSVVVRHS